MIAAATLELQSLGLGPEGPHTDPVPTRGQGPRAHSGGDGALVGDLKAREELVIVQIDAAQALYSVLLSMPTHFQPNFWSRHLPAVAHVVTQ